MRSSTSLYREFPTSSTSVQNKNSSSKRHQTHAFDPACSHMQADASHMMQQPSAQDRLDTAEAGAAADGVRQRGVKQHSSRSAMRLCAVLLVLLLLGVPLSVAGSEMAVPPVCASGSAEVQETMEALMRIHSKLGGPRWTFYKLTEVIGSADAGTLRWGSCDTCAMSLANVSPGHGTISLLHKGAMPSYCCWRGVSCCNELQYRPQDFGGGGGDSSSGGGGGGGLGGGQQMLDPARHAAIAPGCEPFSVTSLQLWGLNLTGPFHSIMPELQVLHSHGLRHLDLSKNALTGTLPATIGSMTNLTHLLLGSNNISGTVPPSLSEMRQLRQLDLEINKLTGGLMDQQQLCADPNNSLELLLIRGNNFSGRLDLTKCTKLQLADLQGNRFSGSLPVDNRNRALSVLRADHNNFSGTIPLGLWDLPALMALELTNNSLSGTLPKAIASANFLTQLRLGSNRFSGSVPLAINTLSHLAELDLSDNIGLTGTLPSMNWMLGLQSLSVRHTLLGGTIPHELSQLPYLESVDVRDTRMTCCASLEEAQARRANGTLLPSYLTLDQAVTGSSSSSDGSDAGGNSNSSSSANSVEEEYVTAAGNMKCGMVKRSPDSSMVAQGWVSKPVNVSRQTWMVAPEYTWFMRCSCIKGYEPGPFTLISTPAHCNRTNPLLYVNGSNSLAAALAAASPAEAALLLDPACSAAVTAVMTCRAVAAPAKLNVSLIAGIVSGGAVLLLLMLLLYLSFRRLGRIRRQLEWWRKHLAGMPRCGEMSLVVTDIEGYSGMFKRAPEQMYRALTLHNNVIRAAKYAHCGSIIQQEGDSFILAFHTPFDAVAFCLQVQLGLMEVPWPKGLMELSEGGAGGGGGGGGGGSGDGSGGIGAGAAPDDSKQQQQQASGDSSSSPTRRKLSHRLEGVSSILLSPASASKLRKSRLASGSPPPPSQAASALPAPAFEAAAAAGGPVAAPAALGDSPSSSPKQMVSRGMSASSSSAAGAGGNGNGRNGSSSAGSSPTKQLGERCRRPASLQTNTCSSSSSNTALPAASSVSLVSMLAVATTTAAAGGNGGSGRRSGSPTFCAGGSPAATTRLASRGDNSSSTSRSLSYFAAGAGPSATTTTTTTTAAGILTATSSRILSSLGVGHHTGGSGSGSSSITGGLFRAVGGGGGGGGAGGSSKHGAAAAGGAKDAVGGSSDGSSNGSDGLFVGLRVRMGVVTGNVHWENCGGDAAGGGGSGSNRRSSRGGANSSNSSSPSNTLAAIINSSLYKLAIDVSDAGNGGQVLLDASTFGKIKEELAPLGAVDANGIDHAQLEAARAPSMSMVWGALCCGSSGGRRRDAWGAAARRVHELDEAVVLDMGLWQKQALPPTTPTSPAPITSAAAAAAAALRSSLPGAIPTTAHRYGGVGGGTSAAGDCCRAEGLNHQQPSHHHPFSLPVSPASSHNGGNTITGGPFSPTDAAGGGVGGLGWSGGWGGWGTLLWGGGGVGAAGSNNGNGTGGGAAVVYGGYGGGQGAHSCATAGSCSEHGGSGGVCLRLYQVLSPSLSGRAAVWGDALSLKGSWTCLDAPYFEAPGALFYSVFTHSSTTLTTTRTSSITAGPGSRSSSMTKASDTKYWSAKLQQHQQLTQQLLTAQQLAHQQHHQHQQQQQQQSHKRHCQQQQQQLSLLVTSGSSDAPTSRQSSTIPALHAMQQQQQQQQQRQGYGGGSGGVYSQLTVFAAQDVEAPGVNDQLPTTTATSQQQQQQQQVSLSPLQGHRSASQSSAAAAAAAAVGVPPPLLLPAVTLMFVSVDGAKVLRKHHLREAHTQLSLLFMEALRHVQGAYMCRMQAGDLKYMVSFASASAALQWALLVQEAAMYLDYPAAFERVPQLRSEYDPRGQLVFRGPRLRIGLCEGVPRTVMPDHVGRADYYGSSVNMAARYMDAAAHGGQIACELELAMAAMQQWAAAAGGGAATGDNSNSCSSDGCGLHQSAGHITANNHINSSSTSLPFVQEQQEQQPRLPALAVSRLGDHTTSSGASTPLSGVAHSVAHDTSCSNSSFTSSDSPHCYSSLPPAAAAAGSGAMVLGSRRQQQHQQLLYPTSSDASTRSSCLQGGGIPAVYPSLSGAAAAFSSSDGAAMSCQQSLPQHLQHLQLQQQQQQQQQPYQPQWEDPPVFGLQDPPMLSAAVEVQRLGAFRFKGSHLQQQMVNVTLSSLSGRARFTPSQPPKGKGERVVRHTGLAAVGAVPLPALSQQYRARVPAHILECADAVADTPTAAAARDAVDGAGQGHDVFRECEALRGGGLRVGSAPQHLMMTVMATARAAARAGDGAGSGRQQQAADGAGGVAAAADGEGPPGADDDVLTLRQKSHSFTCPASPGLL